MKTIENITGQPILLEEAQPEDLILEAHGTLEVSDAKAAIYLLIPNVRESI